MTLNTVAIKMNINKLPDGDRYESLPRGSLLAKTGGFNLSVSYFSVSRKGDCTLIGHSDDCTYSGDDPSKTPTLPPGIPRVLERVRRHGNGAWDAYRLYV